jgi:uroporphyrinogen decarboxylase
MGLFNDRTKKDSLTQVPVWFMRQAGRYHAHYQSIKKDSDFMKMCKSPELACEITMGPIRDFDFDAAILFSDLLFPLERLGFGLSYESGPPTLDVHLEHILDFQKLDALGTKETFYQFQADALSMLKKTLPVQKTLLGFVGAPFTLYSYAVEGSHSGNLVSSKCGFYDGRFGRFMERLMPELLSNVATQFAGGADAMCFFDTAAGELTPFEYEKMIAPLLRQLFAAVKARHPGKPIIYYSKFTNLGHLERLENDHIDVLGVDWRLNITDVLNRFGKDYYIQGNLDPSHLFYQWPMLEKELTQLYQRVLESSVGPAKWICGLGHGVLPKTPEQNVKSAVDLIHQKFLY